MDSTCFAPPSFRFFNLSPRSNHTQNGSIDVTISSDGQHYHSKSLVLIRSTRPMRNPGSTHLRHYCPFLRSKPIIFLDPFRLKLACFHLLGFIWPPVVLSLFIFIAAARILSIARIKLSLAKRRSLPSFPDMVAVSICLLPIVVSLCNVMIALAIYLLFLCEASFRRTL